MTQDEKKLYELNRDISGMMCGIKNYTKQRKAFIEANDYASAEIVYEKEKTLNQHLAIANHRKLKLTYPQADAVYEDRIVKLCSTRGLYGMKNAGLIECCANINGRKLYAI